MGDYGDRIKEERKIDWLVAEHIFHATYLDPDAAGILLPLEVQLPHYSTDIKDAWQVVEWIVGKDCTEHDLFIECWADGEWFVAFHPFGYSSRKPCASDDGKKTGSPSAPLAICRAALKSVGIEVE